MKRFLMLIIVPCFVVVFTADYLSACTQFQRLFGCKDTPAPVATVPGLPATTAQFVPSFEAVNMVTYFTDGRTVSQPINDTYFAEEVTAGVLSVKFGATRVEMRPTEVTPGGKTVYASGPRKDQIAAMRVLVFLPGAVIRDNHGDILGTVKTQFEINAGILADFYRRMPEKNFPAFSYIYGFPPQTQYFLSLPEQYVWRTIYSFAVEANSVTPGGPGAPPNMPGTTTI